MKLLLWKDVIELDKLLVKFYNEKVIFDICWIKENSVFSFLVKFTRNEENLSKGKNTKLRN